MDQNSRSKYDAGSEARSEASSEARPGALPEVSVVMPCLNEEDAIGVCIEKIQKTLSGSGINGEIVVCDNGSTDRTAEIARSMGVNVVEEPIKGYGQAYLTGFANARGKYLVMGDADDTYDFTMIPQFIEKLKEGNEFVTGSRYAGGGSAEIKFLHRIIGNPMLTFILNVMFGCKFTDVYCGFRAFTREAYNKIRPVSTGMEFNLELAINASLANLKIAEIPIVLHERIGESKLRTFRDGWRSLRMMLLYCPNKVFLLPGMLLFLAGMVIHVLVLTGSIHHDGRTLSSITGVFATVFAVVGFQILSLGLHAKTYSWSRRFDTRDAATLTNFYKCFNLEMGLVAGLIMIILGCGILGLSLVEWFKSDMLPLSHPEWIPFAATLVIIGFNIVFSSLFISAMSMTKNAHKA